ncbi:MULTISPECIES: VWA domain-containing protein [unclassified Chelatococcus]|uniref:VWA domain-containing protein n=1 Tax=unclassified Chelatococcus TaxID=2638111 RepID=UPI001BD0E968|nr:MULTISPECIES: VWA domain-containing protein [unclassified Chelatococcus]MBS7698378.1 VWA domain-containing protein [Chelatococcus sp. YT9]MBX3558855.1 VWA domain-containing protein [Chelatococcus sp.]
MLSFAYPWVALLLPAPLAIYALMPPWTQRRPGLRVPFFGKLAALTGASPLPGVSVGRRGFWRTTALVLCWCLALVAMMRPQWIEPPIHRDKPARDMLLLVDLSGSMDTTDFTDPTGAKINRLSAVKLVLDDFLARREGDRIGIVVFGNAPFTLVPFSTDLDLVRRLLQEMQVGMAGPRTVFGDAIGLGINLFAKSTAPAKTMIALTDGNDTASSVPPAEAARVAADRGIVIHTVAIGDPTAAGEEKLDEAALQDVARTTGGAYYRALDRAELAGIYARLDAVETRKVETVVFQPKIDLFWLPLAALTLFSMLVQALRFPPWAGWRAAAGERS